MSYRERFEELFAKRASLIKPGLKRMAEAYDFLGKPGHHTPTVLIGGTNGKGSTAGYLYSLTRAAGLKTGLYTSPHLVSYSERIRCSTFGVCDADLTAVWHQLRESLPARLYDELSFFEMTTLIALQTFADAKLDFIILEVGLGGRSDATNVVDPIASAIVSIGYDHEDILGHTLTAIASEKLGILRQGRPLFLGSGGQLSQEPEALQLVIQEAAAAGSPLKSFGEDFDVVGDGFRVGQDLFCFPAALSHAAPFLKENFILAAALFHGLRQSLGSNLPELAALLQSPLAFDAPTLAGRFQSLTIKGRPVLFDVCHNLDGVSALQRSLAMSPLSQKPVAGLVTILKDKKINVMLDILKGFLNPLVLFKVESDRSLQPELLAERHRHLPLMPDFAAGWREFAAEQSGDAPVVICGSVFGVGKAFEYFSADLATTPVGRSLYSAGAPLPGP